MRRRSRRYRVTAHRLRRMPVGVRYYGRYKSRFARRRYR